MEATLWDALWTVYETSTIVPIGHVKHEAQGWMVWLEGAIDREPHMKWVPVVSNQIIGPILCQISNPALYVSRNEFTGKDGCLDTVIERLKRLYGVTDRGDYDWASDQD